MAVVFKVPGRGRLVVRWERAVSNPRRVTVPIEEQVRQALLREVGEGRMEPEQAAARFDRFIRRRALTERQAVARVTAGNPDDPVGGTR